MSDVTEILQLRTDADERCIDRLRELHFNGFVFRGTHGWLSAVPYGGPASLALSKEQLAKFAASIGAPVLNYAVNDFAWGFQLALPDHRTTEFIRWLDEARSIGGIEVGHRPQSMRGHSSP